MTVIFFIELKIMTVINLYIFCMLIYIRFNFSSFFQKSHVHSHNTRNKHSLDVPKTRRGAKKNAGFLRALFFLISCHMRLEDF